MRFFLMGLTFFLYACTSSHVYRTVASGQSDFQNIEVIGASNSAGSGATLPLLARLKDHLIVSIADGTFTDKETIASLQQKKILIAADYFFPTNFPQLKNPPQSVRAETEKRLQSWSRDFDLVLVGLLPNWSDLDPDSKQLVEERNLGNYKNILNILEKNKASVAVVNSAITDFSKTHPNVKVLHLDKMITISMDLYNGKKSLYPYTIPINPFNADKLHFNDHGQAFFLNAVVFPELDKNIPPIRLAENVSKKQMLRALKTILKSKESFLSGEDGGYWFEFIEPNQFLTKNTTLQNTSSESMTPIMRIANVINDNADSRPGFPIYIQLSDTVKKISLDLSSALFYTKIDLFEVNPGEYEGWGYDYWMSAGFTNPPRVNYRFRIKNTSNPDTYLLEWTLYPIVKGQSTDLVRSNTLSESIIKKLKNSSSGSITYNIEIQVRDL